MSRREFRHEELLRYMPLSEPMFLILLVLSEEERHGYAVAREIEERTDGAVRLRTGTLYNALRRLAKQGLVEETEAPGDADPRRRYYRISGLGAAVLDAESRRLERLVRLAREGRRSLAREGAR